MSVTIEDRLHQSRCFNEPIQPEDVEELMALLNEKDAEIASLRQEMLDDEKAFDDREEALNDNLKEQRNFLTKVRDWLDNTTCKRAKIAEECTKWLREHQ
jgi:Skp family chaperone for outer membrane proteins